VSDDKTEEASSKRLQDARDKGQVAQSREAVGIASLALGLLGVGASVGTLRDSFATAVAHACRAAAHPESPQVAGTLSTLGGQFVSVIAYPLGAAVLGATMVGALLTGFLLAPMAALPSLDKLNPSSALERYLKPRTYVEPLVQLAKAAVLIYLGFVSVKPLLQSWAAAASASPATVLALFDTTLRTVLQRMLGLAVGFALADVLYRRWQHAQDMKMSKEELKREHKESEGDPHAKHERERMHKELAQQASLNSVKDAQFVVTNPTHYAIALAWDEDSMEAPQMLAKGEGDFARQMIAEAHRAGVPVLRDPPLARSLHELEIGEQIPELLYESVAAIVRHLVAGNDPDQYEQNDD
jgi:flagellar biosynthesis protein FlhB